MRNLLLISLLVTLCGSCTSSILKGYTKEYRGTISGKEICPVLDFSGGLEKYNVSFDFRKKHFSGMMVIKQVQPGEYRGLFTTHFGFTLMDFSFDRNELRMNHCIQPLNKKSLIKLLHRDFVTLTGLQIPKEVTATVYTSAGNKVYYTKDKSAKGYYRKQLLCGQTEEIQKGKALGLTCICRKPSTGAEQEIIVINHPLLHLCWRLTRIE